MTKRSDREAPNERALQKADVISPVLNEAQLNILLAQTPSYAIKKRPGRGGKAFRYVKYGYVVDQLNKAFGWDWDFKILPIDGDKRYLLTESEERFYNKTSQKAETKTIRNIAVYGEITVRVRANKPPFPIMATITKPGFGSQNWESTIEFGDAL
ncbi:unnamed protein product, partial [marine sediment metagenome]